MPETHPVWNMASAVAPQCTAVVLDRVWWPFLVLGPCSFGVTAFSLNYFPHILRDSRVSSFSFWGVGAHTHASLLLDAPAKTEIS